MCIRMLGSEDFFEPFDLPLWAIEMRCVRIIDPYEDSFFHPFCSWLWGRFSYARLEKANFMFGDAIFYT